MSLATLTKIRADVKKTLSRHEKEQLLKDIQRMLDDEFLKDLGIVPGGVVEIGHISDEAECLSVGKAMQQLKEDYPDDF